MTLVSVLKVFVQMPFASLDWKGFQTVILGLGLLAFSVTNAYPTLWYVDPAATGSTHNGTSWSTAWTSFSSIVWGSSGVKAGDTLYLSGGSTSQTYTSTLTIGASGTASSPLTIALDATNSAHNGMVIFDFSALSPKCTANGIVLQQNYVTINGNVSGAAHIMITNMYNSSAIQGCYSINNGGTGTTATSCIISLPSGATMGLP